MPPPTPRGRRPRPVADAPVGDLLDRADELAKGWLIALLEDRPLEDAAQLPIGSIVSDAPALCEAVVRAIGSDEALERLGSAPELAPLVGGVGELAGAADAFGAVNAVEALRAVIWSAVVETAHGADPRALAELSDRLAHVCARVAAGASGRPSGGRAAGEPPVALERRIARWTEMGGRFALLAVEVDDLERLADADPAAAEQALSLAQAAIREQLPRPDQLLREAPGRMWAIMPDGTRAAAGKLAGRLAKAVEMTGAPQGAPLTISVGVAIHPDDGDSADALAARAEEGMLAARAAGVRVERTNPSGPRLVS